MEQRAGNYRKLSGGATDLMNGTFEYSPQRLQPVVNYSDNGASGRLTINQPSGQTFTNYRNNWDVRLNNNVTTDLKINTGKVSAIWSCKSARLKIGQECRKLPAGS